MSEDLGMTDANSAAPLLQVQQVTLAANVGLANLLKDLSFQVNAGEFVALIGPSGSGKTSLLRLLNRLNDPSSGSIQFNGQDMQRLSPLQLRRQVTLVLQEADLLDMTVRQALTYPLTLRGLSDAKQRERLGFWLEQLNIPDDWLPRTALQLSVGQRQLVAIARGLVTEPTVLLLDEPTAALDLGRASRLMTVLRNLAQRQQTAILMANHQLDLVQDYCDRVLYLQQGELKQDAAVDQIDWVALRHRLVNAEKQLVQEWD